MPTSSCELLPSCALDQGETLHTKTRKSVYKYRETPVLCHFVCVFLLYIRPMRTPKTNGHALALFTYT